MQIIPDNAQHIGARKQQEDAFRFSVFDDEEMIQKRGHLAIIADGMGGLSHGQDVSNIAVQTFLASFQDLTKLGTIPQLLYGALVEANVAVNDFAMQKNLQQQIGTTLIAATIHDNQLHWISVGDSRIYLFRNNVLTQLTEDHVYEKELFTEMKNEQITREQVLLHPQKDALTSFIGLENLSLIDYNIKPLQLQAGDKVLLCSDGLHGFLEEKEIITVLSNVEENVCQVLISSVLEKNHPFQDNVTVALLNYKKEFSKTAKLPPPTIEIPIPKKKKRRVILSLSLITLLSVGGYFLYDMYFKENSNFDFHWNLFNKSNK
jgi:PPM family protein phosphatase